MKLCRTKQCPIITTFHCSIINLILKMVPNNHCYRLSVSPQNSYVEILIPKVMILEGGAFGKWLGHESGVHINELSSQTKEAAGISSTLSPCEVTVRRRPSVRNQSLSWYWMYRCHDLGDTNAVYKPPNLWYSCYTRPNKLRQLPSIKRVDYFLSKRILLISINKV